MSGIAGTEPCVPGGRTAYCLRSRNAAAKLPLFDGKYGAGGFADDSFGDATDHHVDQAATTVGAHDDHVGVAFFGVANNLYKGDTVCHLALDVKAVFDKTAGCFG